MLAEWTAVIFILPSTLLAGFFLGYYVLDPWLGTYPVLTFVFILIGAAAGFYQVFRIVLKKY